MSSRTGPVHVATTRRRYRGRLYETHLLRRTYREGGKVKHETLGNISHLPADLIEMIRAALRGERFVPASAQFEIMRSLPHGHVAAVLGSLRRLELDHLIAAQPCRSRDLVVAMIVARILEPRSKLATARQLRAETACSTLGQVLGIEQTEEDDLYEAMDWLLERQARIEAKLARRHLMDGSLVLYDVSSSYYTGTHCALAQFGHSHDGKKGFPQVLYGLLCNGEGCPVAVEAFEGNVGEPKTLGSQIQKVRQRFGLNRLVWVGDRGMITAARIREELAGQEGLGWITALRAPAIRALAEAGRIPPSLFDERDLAEIHSPDYPGERLIACRNPFLARERAVKREDLLRATEKELDLIVAATQRRVRPLRGQEQIALRVGKVINRHKVEKHFKLTFSAASLAYERDAEKIQAEAALDGIYIIRTSVSEDAWDAPDAVRAYKQLSRVERAFRSLKTIDLKVRPIHHRLADRVRAHVFVCMLAYYVEWHMRQRLASILFDDDDKETAESMRASVVAPARRSPSALHKAQTKRNGEDEPVHSFRTLLKDLATITSNRVRPRWVEAAAAEFETLATPTPLQRKAFGLLEVPLNT